MGVVLCMCANLWAEDWSSRKALPPHWLSPGAQAKYVCTTGICIHHTANHCMASHTTFSNVLRETVRGRNGEILYGRRVAHPTGTNVELIRQIEQTIFILHLSSVEKV